MNDPRRLDATVAGWLADGPDVGRAGVLEAALARARTTGQRAPWQTAVWWRSGPVVSTVWPRAKTIAIVAVVITALVGTAALVATGRISFREGYPLVFSRSDSVFVAAPDGSRATLVYTAPAGYGVADVRWSPDHSRIAIQLGSAGEADAEVVDRPVVVIDRSGFFEGRFDGGSGLVVTWSPDGSRLAVLGTELPHAFILLDRNARPVGSIALPDALEIGFSSWAGPFSWSPSGREIAMPGCWSPCDPKVAGALFLVAVDGSGVRQLTDGAASDTWLAWSQDGRLAAVRTCSATPSSCATGVVVMDTDGSAEQIAGFAGFLAGALAWSPDGRQLAAVGHLPALTDTAGAFRLRVWAPGETAVEALSAGFSTVGQVEWSADGRAVVFDSVRAGSTPSLWSLEIESGSITELVRDIELFDADARP